MFWIVTLLRAVSQGTTPVASIASTDTNLHSDQHYILGLNNRSKEPLSLNCAPRRDRQKISQRNWMVT
jgi:hypothetical protein